MASGDATRESWPEAFQAKVVVSPETETEFVVDGGDGADGRGRQSLAGVAGEGRDRAGQDPGLDVLIDKTLNPRRKQFGWTIPIYA